MKLPSVEELVVSILDVFDLRLGDHSTQVLHDIVLKHLLADRRAVLEAAAEVADGSVKPGWLIAKEIRKLKEDL